MHLSLTPSTPPLDEETPMSPLAPAGTQGPLHLASRHPALPPYSDP